jgi:hypothetical protein
MFYLKNTSMNPSDVVPKDMFDKICANITCKGKECNKVNCNFIQPKRSSELKRETILAITNHFNKRDIGWFNKYHFMTAKHYQWGQKSSRERQSTQQ